MDAASHNGMSVSTMKQSCADDFIDWKPEGKWEEYKLMIDTFYHVSSQLKEDNFVLFIFLL